MHYLFAVWAHIFRSRIQVFPSVLSRKFETMLNSRNVTVWLAKNTRWSSPLSHLIMVIFRSHSAVTTGISVVPPSTDNTTCAKRGSTASHCTKLLTPRISFTDDTIGKVLRIYGLSRRMDSRVYIGVSATRRVYALNKKKTDVLTLLFAALCHFFL